MLPDEKLTAFLNLATEVGPQLLIDTALASVEVQADLDSDMPRRYNAWREVASILRQAAALAEEAERVHS
jgi:hypothetical protein